MKYKYKKKLTEKSDNKDDKPRVAPILKNKKKYHKGNLKRFIATFLTALAIGMPLSFFVYNVVPPIISSTKIEQSIDYFGSSNTYLSKDCFSIGYNKFIPKDTHHIKVFVESGITDSQYQQAELVFDYVNSMFDVINNDYHFELTREEGDSDITIVSKQIVSSGPYGKVVATTNKDLSLFDIHRVVKSSIAFDKDTPISDLQFRFYLAHELMHTILCCYDVGRAKDGPLSLLSYYYINKIIYRVNGLTAYDDFGKNLDLRENFIAYTPYDLSAFIALYGKKENKEACLKLLNDTLNKYKELFGDEVNYFLSDYSLPSLDGEEKSY